MAEIKKSVKPNQTEFQIAARFRSICADYGGTVLPYPAVAANGKNSLILHYTENSGRLVEGDCLMLDAAAEFQGYASDFTRTIPIGAVSKTHRALLEFVDDTKQRLVQSVRRGRIYSLAQLHYESETILRKGLQGFGMKLDIPAMRKVYPHCSSHWIGLDAHDASSVPLRISLMPGCVFSVEPGLCFQMDDPNVPKELKGLGCRFEDTVVLE
jgi:Xaa-Pro aminopeptidase